MPAAVLPLSLVHFRIHTLASCPNRVIPRDLFLGNRELWDLFISFWQLSRQLEIIKNKSFAASILSLKTFVEQQALRPADAFWRFESTILLRHVNACFPLTTSQQLLAGFHDSDHWTQIWKGDGQNTVYYKQGAGKPRCLTTVVCYVCNWDSPQNLETRELISTNGLKSRWENRESRKLKIVQRDCLCQWERQTRSTDFQSAALPIIATSLPIGIAY